jgi:L-rhamnose mutarotase
MKHAEHYYLRDASLREEYIRRHKEIWPEMDALIRESGIYDYTIWVSGMDIFTCFESDDYDRTMKILLASQVKRRWDEYMSDMIDCDDAVSAGIRLAYYLP